MKFLQDNLIQLVLLFLLIAITGYAMATKQLDMINTILVAVLAVLDVKSIIDNK